MQKEIKLLLSASIIVLAVVAVFALPKKEISLRNYSAISGIVVPHHDLVKAQRAEFFDEIAKKIKPPKTVVLVSPNHFSAGRADVQTTDKTWNLSNGLLEPNLAVIGAVRASIETPSFATEHGIYSVLPDIHRVWPQATIVPIMLKMDASIQALHDELKKNCDECLLVASVDFSHYQPAVLANEHDQLTIRALQNLDRELIREKAEVDSPPSLELFIAWARSHQTHKFTVWKHTNSGDLLHDPDIETTTHVFGAYERGEAVQPQRRVSFLIGGDMMFARGIHATFESDLKASVANLGDRLFWGTDASIINLEGAISATPVRPDPGPTFKFVFPPQTVDVLKHLHINAVSQDNNHAGNGDPAVTRELLKNKNIPVLPATFEGEGLKLTVIGIHTLWGVTDITQQITMLKQEGDMRVIVMPHWGEEYKSLHNAQQEQLAHAWIDAGADLIIGAHPHVIQDAQVYRGKPIFYSIGNLLFDQDWSVPTQQGMLIGGAFTEDGLQLFGLPVVSKNHKPELARGLLKAELLKKIEGGMLKP